MTTSDDEFPLGEVPGCDLEDLRAQVPPARFYPMWHPAGEWGDLID